MILQVNIEGIILVNDDDVAQLSLKFWNTSATAISTFGGKVKLGSNVHVGAILSSNVTLTVHCAVLLQASETVTVTSIGSSLSAHANNDGEEDLEVTPQLSASAAIKCVSSNVMDPVLSN